jgi:hypothetical protein
MAMIGCRVLGVEPDVQMVDLAPERTRGRRDDVRGVGPRRSDIRRCRLRARGKHASGGGTTGNSTSYWKVARAATAPVTGLVSTSTRFRASRSRASSASMSRCTRPTTVAIRCGCSLMRPSPRLFRRSRRTSSNLTSLTSRQRPTRPRSRSAAAESIDSSAAPSRCPSSASTPGSLRCGRPPKPATTPVPAHEQRADRDLLRRRLSARAIDARWVGELQCRGGVGAHRPLARSWRGGR